MYLQGMPQLSLFFVRLLAYSAVVVAISRRDQRMRS